MTEPAYDVLSGFAGPGGWEEGAKILGIHDQILGVELAPHASAAGIAAGHRRLTADIRSIDPTAMRGVKGCLLSSPCPPWSAGAGAKQTAVSIDYQVVLDVVTHLGSGECSCSWDEIERELEIVVDPRTALAAQLIRFALLAPDVEWLAFEQVPAAEYLFEDIAAELFSWGWQSADVFMLDALQLGMPVRRKRVFLVARRSHPLGYIDPNRRPRGAARHVQHPLSVAPVVGPTMAEVLGWDTGHRVRTRGNRKATGGNFFPADGPSWCMTEKARTWERDDGLRLTAPEAGLLQGFRPNYPWTGSRTRQFHQLADVVCPPVAAAVLGYVNGTDWQQPVANYLGELYSTSALDRQDVA